MEAEFHTFTLENGIRVIHKEVLAEASPTISIMLIGDSSGSQELIGKEGYTIARMQQRFYGSRTSTGPHPPEYRWSCGGEPLEPELSLLENGLADGARLSATELRYNPFCGAYAETDGPEELCVGEPVRLSL